MKQQIQTLIALLGVSAICIQGIGVHAETLGTVNTIHMPTGDMGVMQASEPLEIMTAEQTEELEAEMAGYVRETEDLLINRASSFYYYNTLNPVAKEIYDVVYGVAKDPVSTGNVGLVMTDIDPYSDEYFYEFNVAIRAICFDHPELFWLYSGEEADMCYQSTVVKMNGIHFVYFQMAEYFEKFEEEMKAFNQAADDFLADIDTGISDYETIRQVHDKLIDLVDYNDPVANGLRMAKGQDLAHTAYGALVKDSSGNANYAVCDGYSLAFEYLLQQCGIECVFVAGKAGASEEDSGLHAWNVVKMDGKWYEIDTTWDDSGSVEDDLIPGTIESDLYMEALSDPEFRELLDHKMFLLSTAEIANFVPGEEYTYLSKDQQYYFSPVAESFHKRMYEIDNGLESDQEIIAAAPIAESSYQGR